MVQTLRIETVAARDSALGDAGQELLLSERHEWTAISICVIACLNVLPLHLAAAQPPTRANSQLGVSANRFVEKHSAEVPVPHVPTVMSISSEKLIIGTSSHRLLVFSWPQLRLLRTIDLPNETGAVWELHVLPGVDRAAVLCGGIRPDSHASVWIVDLSEERQITCIAAARDSKGKGIHAFQIYDIAPVSGRDAVVIAGSVIEQSGGSLRPEKRACFWVWGETPSQTYLPGDAALQACSVDGKFIVCTERSMEDTPEKKQEYWLCTRDNSRKKLVWSHTQSVIHGRNLVWDDANSLIFITRTRIGDDSPEQRRIRHSDVIALDIHGEQLRRIGMRRFDPNGGIQALRTVPLGFNRQFVVVCRRKGDERIVVRGQMNLFEKNLKHRITEYDTHGKILGVAVDGERRTIVILEEQAEWTGPIEWRIVVLEIEGHQREDSPKNGIRD